VAGLPGPFRRARYCKSVFVTEWPHGDAPGEGLRCCPGSETTCQTRRGSCPPRRKRCSGPVTILRQPNIARPLWTESPERRFMGVKILRRSDPQSLLRHFGCINGASRGACDSQGPALDVHVTPGQQHENRALELTMQRAYSPRRARLRLASWRQGLLLSVALALVAPEPDRPCHNHSEGPNQRRRLRHGRVLQAEHYRAGRVGWSKECRRLPTRFEKLGVDYVAFWLIAFCFRLLGPRKTDSSRDQLDCHRFHFVSTDQLLSGRGRRAGTRRWPCATCRSATPPSTESRIDPTGLNRE
jgi:hypothetical protein